MSKGAWLTAAVIPMVFMSAGANAAGICWIDNVTKSSKGVEIHFMNHATLNVFMTGRAQLEVVDGVARQIKKNGAPGSEVPLVLTEGQIMSVNSGMPEDTCTISYAIENGVPGINALSANHASPYAQTETSRFYPAG